MTTNGGQQASPKHQPITDQTPNVKRRRFRRIKSSQIQDPLSDNDKHTNAIKPPTFYPSNQLYWKFALIMLAYIAAGTLCFHLTRHQISGTKTNSVLDGLYFTMVTVTSVGYGDLVPDSTLTKLLTYLFVVSGILIVVFILTKAAELLVEKQSQLFVTEFKLNETIGGAESIKIKVLRRVYTISVVLLLILMAGGIGMLLWVEDLGILHAFYCVMGTFTGVVYVDKCFSTIGGRVYALVWIIATTVLLIQLVFVFALANTEIKQRALVKWVLKRKTLASDLEAADFDGDGVVSAAEFILYKLKEMGKINQNDITPIMDVFQTHDFSTIDMLPADDLFLR